MPFIRIYGYSGRDLESKQEVALAIMKTAGQVLGAGDETFTIMFDDVERENWQEEIVRDIVAQNRDKLLIESGKLV